MWGRVTNFLLCLLKRRGITSFLNLSQLSDVIEVNFKVLDYAALRFSIGDQTTFSAKFHYQ